MNRSILGPFNIFLRDNPNDEFICIKDTYPHLIIELIFIENDILIDYKSSVYISNLRR